MGTCPYFGELSPTRKTATGDGSSLTCPLVTAWGHSMRLVRASQVGVLLAIVPGRYLFLGYRRSLKRLEPHSLTQTSSTTFLIFFYFS